MAPDNKNFAAVDSHAISAKKLRWKISGKEGTAVAIKITKKITVEAVLLSTSNVDLGKRKRKKL